MNDQATSPPSKRVSWRTSQRAIAHADESSATQQKANALQVLADTAQEANRFDPAETLGAIITSASDELERASILARVDLDPTVARRLLEEGPDVASAGLQNSRYGDELSLYRNTQTGYPELVVTANRVDGYIADLVIASSRQKFALAVVEESRGAQSVRECGSMG